MWEPSNPASLMKSGTYYTGANCKNEFYITTVFIKDIISFHIHLS